VVKATRSAEASRSYKTENCRGLTGIENRVTASPPVVGADTSSTPGSDWLPISNRSPASATVVSPVVRATGTTPSTGSAAVAARGRIPRATATVTTTRRTTAGG
jgi:hypothetical protein